ncbi:TetR/AcrR family transcriptional regulator [Bacteroidota bacterium]
MENDPKKRILNVATELFAQKGYAAVGVREIANEADVNLSMISYYYGGKVGLLKSITEEFFNEFKKTFLGSFHPEAEFEVNTFQLGRSIVELFRTKTSLTKIGLIELPNEVPEITAFKTSKITEMFTWLGSFIKLLGVDHEKDWEFIAMIGPGLLNLMFSHFLMLPLVKGISVHEFDDNYYDMYSIMMGKIILSGLPTAVDYYKKNSKNNKKK